MAKKAAAKSALTKPKAKPKAKSTSAIDTSDVRKEVAKLFDDSVIVEASSLLDIEREVIPISPAFDAGLGGGLQKGTLNTISGPPRCGKTTTCWWAAMRCQQRGMKVVYINAERPIEKRTITGTKGLNADEVEVVQSTTTKLLTAQDLLLIAETYITSLKNLVIVIDSVSAMLDEREKGKELKEQTMGGTGSLMARFIRRNTPAIAVNNHIVICIGHVYANMGKGKKWLEQIGSKVDYALSTKIMCQTFKATTVGSDDKEVQIGQEVEWRVERTPLGPPNKKVVSYIRYDYGIDVIKEIMIEAQHLNLIKKPKQSSWYELNFLDEPVSKQGEEAVWRYLSENPEAYELLNTKIAEMTADD